MIYFVSLAVFFAAIMPVILVAMQNAALIFLGFYPLVVLAFCGALCKMFFD
jgi:hypothetical protein